MTFNYNIDANGVIVPPEIIGAPRDGMIHSAVQRDATWDRYSNGAWTTIPKPEPVIIPIPEPEPIVIPEPTPAEIRQGKITALNAEYQYQFNDLAMAYVKAQMSGDTETMNDIFSENAVLRTEYNTKMEAIINGG